jgi:hypothetical protein
MAAGAVLDEISQFIEIARSKGGPAKLILALEPEQGSTVMGAIYEIEQYDLTRLQALR